jgi:hypothetical protein
MGYCLTPNRLGSVQVDGWRACLRSARQAGWPVEAGPPDVRPHGCSPFRGGRLSKPKGPFPALGRVVRTIFLLRFMNEEELRRTISAATNIAEAWNGFVQWVAFGGEGVIRQNNREEQRKIIRYNHLVANLVVFHNEEERQLTKATLLTPSRSSTIALT